MREGDERDQAEAEPETPGHAQRTAVLCDDARPATVTVPASPTRFLLGAAVLAGVWLGPRV